MWDIYTDGSGTVDAPGGWAFVAVCGQNVIERTGWLPVATNNQMEVTAVCEALAWANPDTMHIRVLSDSEYCVNGFTRWVHGWAARGWVTGTGSPVKNQELWERAILELARHPTVVFEWLRGHAGARWNERADQLATQARLEGIASVASARQPVEDITLF